MEGDRSISCHEGNRGTICHRKILNVAIINNFILKRFMVQTDAEDSNTIFLHEYTQYDRYKSVNHHLYLCYPKKNGVRRLTTPSKYAEFLLFPESETFKQKGDRELSPSFALVSQSKSYLL